jgi:hypothetical protein
MSNFPAVEVTTGAPPPLHFTPVNVAEPPPVVASCFNKSTKLLPAVAVGIVNVQSVLAVNVAVWTVPEVKLIVDAVVTVPIATTDSV